MYFEPYRNRRWEKTKLFKIRMAVLDRMERAFDREYGSFLISSSGFSKNRWMTGVVVVFGP